MGIKNRIQSIVKTALGIPTGGVWLSGTGGSSTAVDNGNDVYSTFAYICIMKRSNYLSSIESIIEPAELSALFESPNAIIGTSWNELKVLVSEGLDVHGNAYLYAPLMGTRVPQQLWYMPKAKIRPVMVGGFVEHYILNNNQRVGKDEIIHFKNVSPKSTWQDGIARELEAIQAQNDLDVKIQKFMSNHYENHAIPPLVVENSGGTLQQSQYELFKFRFSEQIPDGVISMLLEGGLTVKPLDLGFEKMMSSVSGNLSLDLQQRIAMAFGVPLSLLTGEYKYQTAEATRAEFMQTVIEPRHTYIDQVLTSYFGNYYEDAKFDYVPYESPEEPGGYFNFGMKKNKALVGDVRTEYWHKKMISHGAGERRLAKKVLAVYREMSAEIENNLALITESKGLTENISAVMSLDVDFWRKKVESVVAPELREIVILSIRESMKEIGEGFIVSDWDRIVMETVAESSRQLSTSVSTIQDNLAKIIADSSVASGVNFDLLKAKVADLLSEVEGGKKVGVIARTSTTRAMTNAQAKSFEKKGRTYYWLTERDDRVRDSHKRMDGEEVNVMGEFVMPDGSVTTNPAGAGLSAGEAINCRCILYPGKKK